MIRHTTLFFFALALQACAPIPDPFSLGTDINSAFSEAPESDFLRQHPERASRKEDELTLVFSNGKSLSLKDNREKDCDDKPEGESGPCYTSFRVIGYWPLRDLFLLDILYYEGSSAALVGNNGTVEYIPGRPVFAYDMHRFAAFSIDCVFSSVSDISVSEFVDGHIEEFFSDMTGDGIGIGSVRWINNNRLSVELFDCIDGYETTTRWQAFLQKQRSNNWVWEGNSTQIPGRMTQ